MAHSAKTAQGGIWTGTCSYCRAAVRLPATPREGAKVRCPACRTKQENAREATRKMGDLMDKFVEILDRGSGPHA